MTSRSYFGKMDSTLGSVVPLAMFVIYDGRVDVGAVAGDLGFEGVSSSSSSLKVAFAQAHTIFTFTFYTSYYCLD